MFAVVTNFASVRVGTDHKDLVLAEHTRLEAEASRMLPKPSRHKDLAQHQKQYTALAARLPFKELLGMLTSPRASSYINGFTTSP